MKKVIFIVIIFTVFVGFLSAKGDMEKDDSKDIAAIEAVWEAYGQARTDGNPDAWLAIHDLEALKMPQGSAQFNPWDIADGIRNGWKKQDAESSTTVTVTPEEIIILGDYAYSKGSYHKVVTPDNGGESVEFDGKFLTVLKKNGNGEWLIYRDSYGSNS